MTAPQMPRLLRLLKNANRKRPVNLDITKGNSHWKLFVNGKMIAIYPLTPAREGFADNTKSTLRNAGLILPGESHRPKRRNQKDPS